MNVPVADIVILVAMGCALMVAMFLKGACRMAGAADDNEVRMLQAFEEVDDEIPARLAFLERQREESGMGKGTIAVDLDGTLAAYGGWQGHEYVGPAIPEMLERVHAWLASGYQVVIFTARVYDPAAMPPIRRWLEMHGLEHLEVTNIKRPDFVEMWDDRAFRVHTNTGKTSEQVHANHINYLRRIVAYKAPHAQGCKFISPEHPCTCWKSEFMAAVEL